MVDEIRQLRRKFRGDLHDRLGERVSLTIAGTDCVIQGLTCRLHDKLRMVGDVKGTSLEFATLHENTPQAVFRLAQITVENPSILDSGFVTYKDILSTSSVIRLDDEDGIPLAYEITDREPVHGITVNVNLTRLSDKRACTFALPETVPLCPPST